MWETKLFAPTHTATLRSEGTLKTTRHQSLLSAGELHNVDINRTASHDLRFDDANFRHTPTG